jgi:hypothetical protein
MAENLEGKMKKEHPRLFISENDIERIKNLIEKNEEAKRIYEKIKERAEKICNEEVTKYEIPDGLRLLGTSRKVLDRVYILSFVFLIEKDEKYLKRAWEELKSASEFPDFNPKHFLDVAEMSHAFAIGYDWLYKFLNKKQKDILKNAVLKNGLKPAIECYRGKSQFGWWVKSKFNWNQVCNGGIGIAAIAFYENFPEISNEILENIFHSLPIAMESFSPDGAWPEGPSYWNYATKYNFLFISALESSTGDTKGLLEIEGVSKTGLFPIYMTGPIDKTFNFADAPENTFSAFQVIYLSKKFNIPVYSWFAFKYLSPNPFYLIWFEKFKDPLEEKLPKDKYFRNVEVVSMRNSWDDRNSLFIGFKAGKNSVGHAHLDIGSFVLDASGYRWVVDLGADNYNLPGYFGKNRWDYYRLRAEGHNTVVINPSNQPDQEIDADTKIIKFVSKDTYSFAIADIKDAYRKFCEKFERGILLDKKDKFVIVEDDIVLKDKGEIWWFLHTPANIKLKEDGKKAIMEIENKLLYAIILNPDSCKFSIMEAKPLPSSPSPAGQNENKGIKKMGINIKDVNKLNLRVLLIPVEKNQKLPALKEIKDMSKWE